MKQPQKFYYPKLHFENTPGRSEQIKTKLNTGGNMKRYRKE